MGSNLKTLCIGHFVKVILGILNGRKWPILGKIQKLSIDLKWHKSVHDGNFHNIFIG